MWWMTAMSTPIASWSNTCRGPSRTYCSTGVFACIWLTFSGGCTSENSLLSALRTQLCTIVGRFQATTGFVHLAAGTFCGGENAICRAFSGAATIKKGAILFSINCTRAVIASATWIYAGKKSEVRGIWKNVKPDGVARYIIMLGSTETFWG